MRQVSAAWRAETQKRLMGAVGCRIRLGMIDTDAAPDATVQAASPAPYSASDGMFAAQPTGASYASLEPHRMRLDGKQLIVPAQFSAKAGMLREGYISQELSGGQGVYTAPPMLIFLFTKQHKVAALTFEFDGICGDWPARLRVRAFQKASILADETIQPDAPHFVMRTPLDGFDRLELTFLQSKKPQRRARLQQIMFGEGLAFDGTLLQTVTQKLVADPVCRRLPQSNVQFSLVNRNPLTGAQEQLYHPDNPDGVWQYIEQHSPVQLEYAQTLTGNYLWAMVAQSTWAQGGWHPYEVYEQGGATEYLQAGRYYLTGQPTADSLTAQFEAEDALALMTGIYQKGVYAPQGKSLYDLAQGVLEDARLPLIDTGRVPWVLWEGMRSIATTAPLPCVSHRECLQLLAHAACATLYCSPEGYVCILPAAQEQTALQLPLALQREEPHTEKLQPVGAVQCPALTYTPKPETVRLHQGEYEVAGTLCVWISYTQATAVSAKAVGAGVSVQGFTPYAGAAYVVLVGKGSTMLTVEGKPLEVAAITMAAPVENPLEGALTETLQNPLITGSARAMAVAQWTRDALKARTAYTLSTYGHPEIDVLDGFGVDTLFTKNCAVQILSHTVVYDGSLQSTMITKRRQAL